MSLRESTPSLRLLGREVGGGAHDRTGLGQALLGVHGPGDAEVGDLDVPVRRDQHVPRLHVAVDHAVPVREGQCGGDAGADGGDLAGGIGCGSRRTAESGRPSTYSMTMK